MPADASTPVVVVTGAAGGLGAAIARSFSASGWRSVGVDIRWSVASTDGVHQQIACDISNERAVSRCLEEIETSCGRVDCLVNAAGLTRVSPSQSLAVADWDRVLNVTLRGTFLMSQRTFPMLEASRGSIVNISSISGQRVLPGRLAYSSAKSGLDGLTRSLAAEWAAHGVRVNAVAPAWVDNEFLRKLAADGVLDPGELVEKIPLGRLCTEGDVVEAVRFLSDPLRAGFITGQVLYVDGGYLHAG